MIVTAGKFFKDCLRAQRSTMFPYTTSTGARTDGDVLSQSQAHSLLQTDVGIAKKASKSGPLTL